MTNSFITQLSDGLADAIAAAAVGTVRVDARQRIPATGFVWSSDGVIVTSNHVVRRDAQIQVGLPDGSEHPATLVGRDPSTDIAILKLNTSGLTVLERAESASLRVGQLALAVGRPTKNIQASLGMITALGESWRTGAGGIVDRYLQTDVIMYPGFSGGALINVSGQLIGMNSSELIRGANAAIPTITLNRVVGTLLAHGKVRRGYLGVSTQTVRLPETLRATAGQEVGLLVVGVESNSPADQSGLTLGDTIIQFAGTPTYSHDDLLSLLTSDRVGKSALAQILRGGQLIQLDLLIGEKI